MELTLPLLLLGLHLEISNRLNRTSFTAALNQGASHIQHLVAN
jgi:hypothetical protein